jgi:Protein of unknown function (DUF3574)
MLQLRRSFFCLLALTAGAFAVDVPRPRPQAANPEVWARTELYFGSQKPDGSEVTPIEFQIFINRQVTDRFPDGLTLLTGYGQFKNSQGTIVRETSRVLILFYPKTPDAEKKIEEIRNLYKLAFQQESVLRVDSIALVSF